MNLGFREFNAFILGFQYSEYSWLTTYQIEHFTQQFKFRSLVLNRLETNSTMLDGIVVPPKYPRARKNGSGIPTESATISCRGGTKQKWTKVDLAYSEHEGCLLGELEAVVSRVLASGARQSYLKETRGNILAI